MPGAGNTIDEDAVRTAGQTLLAAGAESAVVHFPHAYANPTHERRRRIFWLNSGPPNLLPPVIRCARESRLEGGVRGGQCLGAAYSKALYWSA